MDSATPGSQYTEGQVACRNKTQCEIDHLDLPARNVLPPLSADGQTAARFMSQLQYSRDTALDYMSMNIAITGHHQTLPQRLRQQVLTFVGDYSNNIFQSSGWGTAEWTETCRRNLQDYIKDFSDHEYVIWPISNEKNHWITAIIHLTSAPTGTVAATTGAPTATTAVPRTHVSQIALVDPLRDADAATRVPDYRGRLEAILQNTFGFTLAPVGDRWRNIWVPEQRFANDNSSGPRAYSLSKETMRRLLELYETGTGYHESLWNDHSGWFHEDSVRYEIISAHAWRIIEGMQYRGRIAVEVVNNVRRNPTATWFAAGDMMRPVAESDPPREPQKPADPSRISLDGPDDGAQPRKRPRFGPGPRGQPRLYPTFSMKIGDGLKNYDGWADTIGRREEWNDPRKTWPRPPPTPPPGNTRTAGGGGTTGASLF